MNFLNIHPAMRFAIMLLVLAAVLPAGPPVLAADWPRWRGPDGNAVSTATDLPVQWAATDNVRWKTAIPGEGSSSPVVSAERVFLTSALENGNQRLTHCLDLDTGRVRWTREITDDDPEITSSLTGHAAPTPVTDGMHLVAFFGNAGVVCYDLSGRRLWHRDFGEFESELGFASSPILHAGSVILVCDHDGDRFGTFDSFVIALEVSTGEIRWKTDRPELFRSWSTPIVVPVTGPGVQNSILPVQPHQNAENPRPAKLNSRHPTPVEARHELVVAGQDELRGYDPATGKHLWTVTGLTGWVAPSPAFAHGLIFAASGRNGPVMAVRPGGRGDVTQTHVVWRHETGGPYVCSPLVYGDELYVHSEQGLLTCYDAHTGRQHHRQRLEGKFTSSAVAAEGRIYLTNEDGVTAVFAAGPRFKRLAENNLGERSLASPAIAGQRILLRTEKHLFCLERAPGSGLRNSVLPASDPPPPPGHIRQTEF